MGDRVLMNLPDRPQTFTVAGIVKFGTDDNLAGVTLAGFDLPTAQTLFNSRGYHDTINVLATPGADNVMLQLAIAKILRRGVQVVSGRVHDLNTFSITVGQRTRELALLRVVGACVKVSPVCSKRRASRSSGSP